MNTQNEDHHIWLNGNFWWSAITVQHKDGSIERKRFSLKTKNIETARKRRDSIFRAISEKFKVISKVDNKRKRNATIPRGYITMRKAANMAGIPVSTMRRMVDRLGIRSKKGMFNETGKSKALFRVVLKADLMKHIPSMQEGIRKTLLTSNK